MVKMKTTGAVVLAVVLILVPGACELLRTSPYPDYIGAISARVDLSSVVESIAGDERDIRYDLSVVSGAGDIRLFLLVEPPSSAAVGTFEYSGEILVFDEDLSIIGRIQAQSSLDYLSRPYGYGHGGQFVTGYTVSSQVISVSPPYFDQSQKLPQHGLTGFVFPSVADNETYLISQPSGVYSGFDLEMRTYTGVTGSWSAPAEVTIPIIPESARPSADDPEYDLKGYQLLGAYHDRTADTLTMLLSQPSQDLVVAARADLVELASGSGVPLLEVSVLDLNSDPDLTGIIADRPLAQVDGDGFFLMRRDGWFVRYDWAGAEVARTVGDTSFLRRYAYSYETDRFFRFDPVSRDLLRIEQWW